MCPLAWSWADVVEASEPDVTVDEGGGLGGPEQEEGPPWPWFVPLWWLEDW